jgi:multiple sugar transport system permease protein
MRARSWGGLRGLLGAFVAAVFLVPLALMLSGSLRRAGAPPPRTPELLPDPLSLGNYGRAFDLVDLARHGANSLLVAAIAVPLSILVASWAGFALSQLRGRIEALVVGLSFLALMVPTTALLVPRFTIFRTLGLTNTYVPLIAPALIGMSPFYVLVYWWSFRRVPRSVFDAAVVDGGTPVRTWWSVGMPIVRGTTAAVALLAFIFTWGNFLDPLIYLFDADLFTLPLGLKSLAQLDPANYPVLLAGAVFATAPVVAAFVVAQRFFLHERKGVGWLGQ